MASYPHAPCGFGPTGTRFRRLRNENPARLAVEFDFAFELGFLKQGFRETDVPRVADPNNVSFHLTSAMVLHCNHIPSRCHVCRHLHDKMTTMSTQCGGG